MTYEIDDLDISLMHKVMEAIEYADNGDPIRDVMDEDDIEDARRLLLKVCPAYPKKD